MSALEFLSAYPAPSGRFGPRLCSPLARALGTAPRGIGLVDLSLALAKLELRGPLGALGRVDLIRITPRRGLVVGPYEEGPAVARRLRRKGVSVIDVTGALAALRIDAPDAATLVRRLTDLDLDRLPAVGSVARVPALVRGGGSAFELYWPQEYGHYLARVVVDAAEGLGRRRLRA